jgi:hypothetical protein
MPGGHNTDLRCGGRRFHVQTEDLGSHLETRVYLGGEIVHSQREAHPAGGDGPEHRRARSEAQHQRVLAELRRGELGWPGPDPFGDRPLVEAVRAFLATERRDPPDIPL